MKILQLGREGGDGSEVQSGEAEEAVPLNVDDDGTLPLKKDIEHLGDPDTGKSSSSTDSPHLRFLMELLLN